MNDYVKQLEEQNEQLKATLAEAQAWKPSWALSDDIYFFGVFGEVVVSDGVFNVGFNDVFDVLFYPIGKHAATVPSEARSKTFSTLEEAKAYVEAMAMVLMRYNYK